MEFIRDCATLEVQDFAASLVLKEMHNELIILEPYIFLDCFQVVTTRFSSAQFSARSPLCLFFIFAPSSV